MRTTGSPEDLEYRRRLAIERIHDGYSAREVADFLGVDPSGVRRRLNVGDIRLTIGFPRSRSVCE